MKKSFVSLIFFMTIMVTLLNSSTTVLAKPPIDSRPWKEVMPGVWTYALAEKNGWYFDRPEAHAWGVKYVFGPELEKLQNQQPPSDSKAQAMLAKRIAFIESIYASENELANQEPNSVTIAATCYGPPYVYADSTAISGRVSSDSRASAGSGDCSTIDAVAQAYVSVGPYVYEVNTITKWYASAYESRPGTADCYGKSYAKVNGASAYDNVRSGNCR